MSGYDYGPLRTYEIRWRHGYVETVQGHQVLFDSHRFAGMFGDRPDYGLPPRFTVHGQFNGRWRLVISAPEADLLSVRDVTDALTELLVADDL